MENKACPVLTAPQPTSMRSSVAPSELLMKSRLPTLITPDAQTGLKLAGELAVTLNDQLNRARAKLERPGGLNYVLPASVPLELISGIVFYAISAANNGWVE